MIGAPTNRRAGFPAGKAVYLLMACALAWTCQLPGQSIPATAAGTATSPSTPTSAGAATARHVEGGRIVTAQGWFAKPTVRRPALPATVTHAYVIPIHAAIDSLTTQAVRRKVIQARGGGAQVVIFDMDTPGGDMHAMLDIVRFITDDLKDIYTIAYIHPRAYSAGAIISLACNEIVMSPTGIIGDAMPIMVGPTGLQPMPAEERGKIESAMRGEVRQLAEHNGYSIPLCESMITLSMEVWLVHNRASGELQYVNAEAWRGKVTSQPAGAAPGDWEYVKTVVSSHELLTMTTQEALELGFTEHVFDDLAQLNAFYHIQPPPLELGDNWSERLVAFLSSAWAMGVLICVGLLCGYIEMHTPGFGVAGTLAVACFALLFGARFLTGLAQWWEIAVFVIGVLLILVELLVFPGHGVWAVSGGILCFVALMSMLVPNRPGKFPWPESTLDWAVFSEGLMALCLGFLSFGVGAMVLAKYLPKVPLAGKLFLAPPAPFTVPPTAEAAPILAIRAGMAGRVVQTCRPVGKVTIENQLLDAVAEGAFLSSGTDVVVLRNEGNRIVVAEKGHVVG